MIQPGFVQNLISEYFERRVLMELGQAKFEELDCIEAEIFFVIHNSLNESRKRPGKING